MGLFKRIWRKTEGLRPLDPHLGQKPAWRAVLSVTMSTEMIPCGQSK